MARRKTTIDFESRSCADLPKVGGWRYAEDETTDIICLAFKTGDDDTVAWIPPWVIEEFGVELGYHTHPETGRVYLFTDDPSALWDAIAEGDIIEAHNAFFERSLWRNIMTKRYGWPDIPDTSWMCSAAKAASYSLPRALEKACEVVKADVAKDEEGAALIRRLCKPRKPTKNDPRVFFGSKEEYERFILYCCEDVEAEHAFSAKLPDLVPFEQRVWQVDQAINERGVYCDIQMVDHIMEMIAEQLDSLTTELRELTDGAINTVGSRKAALEWIADHGYELPNTQGKTLDDFLAEDGIDPVVYRVVQIIRIANRTSTKKFDAMVRRINRDSRIRDTLMYHGANTGRWAGRGVQFQNLPRGVATVMDIVCAMILENDLAGIARNVEEDAMIWQAVDDGLITKDMAKDLARYTSAASDPMELFASVVRGAVCAPEGRELIVADYSAIEARGVLWAAGDQRALDVFRRGEDIYCDMASTIFGRTITKADAKERQVGKAIILACGYSMGANKFLQTCRAQGMVFEMELINQLVSPAKYREIEEAILKLPMVYFKDGITKADMPELVMAKFLVDSYRAKYSMVVDLWNDCEEAAMWAIEDHMAWKAVKDPAKRKKKVWRKAGPVAYKVVGSFLFCKLPSGRMLAYAHPSLRMAKTSWGQEKLTIHFMGVNSMTKKWGRQTTYGGKLVENIVQAISRDMMAYAMVIVEEDPRYDLVLTVHDEIVTEVDEGTGSVEEFEEMIIQKPDWAEGFPMSAEGWRGKRYRK